MCVCVCAHMCTSVCIVCQEYYSSKGSFIIISLGSIFYRVKKGVKHFSLF